MNQCLKCGSDVRENWHSVCDDCLYGRSNRKLDWKDLLIPLIPLVYVAAVAALISFINYVL